MERESFQFSIQPNSIKENKEIKELLEKWGLIS